MNGNDRNNSRPKGGNKPYSKPFKKKIEHKNDIFKGAATAPYNFVRLPKYAMKSDLHEKLNYGGDTKKSIIEGKFKEYINSGEAISGYIDLHLETLTPLFIRGENDNSFMLGNKPVLPGSSIRGMVKNIFKIVTMSSLNEGEDFTNRNLFYRKLMAPKSEYKWAHDLYKLYNSKMKPQNVSSVKPGFLIKVGDKYRIVPVSRDYKDVIKSFRPDIVVNKDEYEKSAVVWSGTKAYIWTGTLGIHELNHKKDKPPRSYLFDTLQEYEAEKKRCNANGSIFDKGKQLVWFLKIEDAQWELAQKVNVKGYLLDDNRGGVNLVDELKSPEELNIRNSLPDNLKIEGIVPCYYVPNEECIVYFGHGKCFRIPYDHSVGDVVKKTFNEKIIDYTDAVFGKKDYFSSRVFFEDAYPVEEVNISDVIHTHPLMQPNPTSYQLYLKQTAGKDLLHWDSPGARIRGYKMYWHQANGKGDIEPTESEKKLDKSRGEESKLCPKMKPIPAKTKFVSRLRFKNLLPNELGALLVSMDLDSPQCKIAFKLGQGKSLGLGSIKLEKYKLHVESKEAYVNFLVDNRMSEVCTHIEEVSTYRDAFEASIPGDLKNDWYHIVGELATMLDYSNTELKGWSHETAVMRADGRDNETVHSYFVNRAVLPTVQEVIERAGK